MDTDSVDPTTVTHRGLRVVETRHDGLVEDGDARADGLGRVIEERLEVGVGREAEARHSLLGAVDDEERSIRER